MDQELEDDKERQANDKERQEHLTEHTNNIFSLGSEKESRELKLIVEQTA